MSRGLLIVFTGDGKGKTTAAIGLAVRAAGHNMKIAFIQFIKGSWPTGEQVAIKHLSNNIHFETLGRGFTWKSDDIEKDKALAQYAWEEAKKAIFSKNYQIVILDEFTYALNYSMLSLKEVLETLNNRPNFVHIVITGRDAPSELIEMADLVTEMKDIKHPFKKGIKAQKGIEF